MDYSKYNISPAELKASSIIESSRTIGYCIENARLQSFLFDFFFKGFKEGQLKPAVFIQICNAVSPFMVFSLVKNF